MSQPTPPAGPEQPEAAAEELELDEPAEAEVPPNRAARRAKAKATTPSHVGPRAGRTDQGRGARSHTKRRTG